MPVRRFANHEVKEKLAGPEIEDDQLIKRR